MNRADILFERVQRKKRLSYEIFNSAYTETYEM